MSITSRNQRLIAYKKLVGKAHTSAQKGASGEAYASSVQSSTEEMFANTPVYEDPTPIFCERILFDLEVVAGSQYIASTDGVEAQGEEMIGLAQENVEHAFALKFPGGHSLAGQYLNSDKKRQLVPPGYDVEFKAKVFDQDGNQMADDGTQDWSLDYYSGLLFMQDMGGGTTPTIVEAYYYTGKYVSDIVVETKDGETDIFLLNADKLKLSVGEGDEDAGQPAHYSNLLLSQESIPPGQAPDSIIKAKINGSVGISQDLEVKGTLYTNKLTVTETTKVVEKTQYSGEAIFGNEDSLDDSSYKDTFTFYGDVKISGSIEVDEPSSTRMKVKKFTQADLSEYNSIDITPEYADYDMFIIEIGNDVDAPNIGVQLPNIVNDSEKFNGKQYVFKHFCERDRDIAIYTNTGVDAFPISPIDGVPGASDSAIRLYVKNESITVVAYDAKWYII
jgi:hypothetical protein